MRIEAADLTVESRARSGRAAAASETATVALDLELTDALRREGRYRELLNRVQTFRKELDLPYTARIRVGLAAPAEPGESAEPPDRSAAPDAGSLLAVAREREAHFLEETLSVALVAGALPGAAGREIEVEGEPATLFVEVAREGPAE